MYNFTQIVYNFTQVVYFFTQQLVGSYVSKCKLLKQWSNSVGPTALMDPFRGNKLLKYGDTYILQWKKALKMLEIFSFLDLSQKSVL